MNYTRPDALYPAIAESGGRASLSPAEIGAGWSTSSQSRPPADVFNARDYYTSAAMKYLCQMGVAEYSANEQYQGKGLCIGSNGSVYWNLIACTGVDPVTDNTGKWEKTAIRRADCAELIGNVTGGTIPETTNILKGNGTGSAAATTLVAGPEGSLETTEGRSYFQAGPRNDGNGTAGPSGVVARLILGILGQPGVAYPGAWFFNTYSGTDPSSPNNDTLDIRHASGGPAGATGAIWSLIRQGTMTLHSGALVVAGAVPALDISKSNVTVNVGGGQASMSFINAGNPVNAKASNIYQDPAGKMVFRFLDDALITDKPWMIATRSGATPTGVTIYADLGVSGVLLVNGITAAGGITIGGGAASKSAWFTTDQNVTYLDAVGLGATRSTLALRQAAVGGTSYVNSLVFDPSYNAVFAGVVTAPNAHFTGALPSGAGGQTACTNIAWQGDVAYYDSFGAGGARGRISFRVGAANGANTFESLTLDQNGSVIAGGGKFSIDSGGNVVLGSYLTVAGTTNPAIMLLAQSLAVDYKNWAIDVAGGDLRFRTINDQNSGDYVWMKASRTGVAPVDVTFSDNVFARSFIVPAPTNNLQIWSDGGSTFIDGGAGGRLLLNFYRPGGVVQLSQTVIIPISNKTYGPLTLSWEKPNRAFGVAYSNYSGMSLQVSVQAITNGGSVGWMAVYMNSGASGMQEVWHNENTASVNGASVACLFTVPPGWQYQVNVSGNITGVGNWFEWACP